MTNEASSSEPQISEEVLSATEPNKAFETENARREREAPTPAAPIVSGDKAGEVADFGAPEDDFTRATTALFVASQEIEKAFPVALCASHPPSQARKDTEIALVTAVMLLLTEVRALKRANSGT